MYKFPRKPKSRWSNTHTGLATS